jgi:hypothetical protein
VFREPEVTRVNRGSLNNSTELSENSTADVKMLNRNNQAPAQVAYFLAKRGSASLDDELHYREQSLGSSIQPTRKSNESDRETSEEEQETRAGQKTRAQDAVDVRA